MIGECPGNEEGQVGLTMIVKTRYGRHGGNLSL